MTPIGCGAITVSSLAPICSGLEGKATERLALWWGQIINVPCSVSNVRPFILYVFYSTCVQQVGSNLTRNAEASFDFTNSCKVKLCRFS